MDGVKMRRPAGGSPLPVGKPSASASPPSPPGGRARSSSASSQASSGGWSSFSSGGDAWLSPSSLAALLPAWRVVDAAARRHGLGTFWLPIMVALRLASPTAAWFLAHGAALVALSLAAHALYAAEARWPVLAGGARTAARCATGCLRWLAMPLAALHCLLAAPGAPAARALCAALPAPCGAPRAFWAGAGAFLAFRAVQVALWAAFAPALPAPAAADGGGAARRLRVLIVGDSIPPKVDGVAVRAGHLVRALTAAGHSVHIVTSIRGEPLDGAGVTRLPGVRASVYPEHSMTVPHPGLLLAIARFRPHVVHILDEGFLAAAAAAACALFLAPTVWSHHSRLDCFAEAYAPVLKTGLLGALKPALAVLQLLRRTFAAASDVHLSVGADMRRQLEDAGCGPHVSEWVCGVDSAAFHPSRRDVGAPLPRGVGGDAAAALRWRLTGGRPHLPIVLYCGRVAPEKRLALLPAVARALAARLRAAGAAPGEPAAAFVVVGGGPFVAPLQAAMAAAGPTFALAPATAGGAPAPGAPTPLAPGPAGAAAAAVTTFCGQVVHGDALGALYATADAFFSPSTCETLGQVFQEAMAAGTLPAGADFGGVPEVVTHGANGYLFPPEDVAGAAHAILRCLADRAAVDADAPPPAGAAVMALPAPLRAGGAASRAAAARARVVAKSWASAVQEALDAYHLAISFRWHSPADVLPARRDAAARLGHVPTFDRQ
jgi:phosphatidylinositol alpha 1,6-mannosyltransferase